MNQLFEALSHLDMDQPSSHEVPRTVAPQDAIQQGTCAAVVDLPMPAPEAEAEQLSPEAIPTNVSPFDVPSLVPAEKAETDQLFSETVPANVSPFDVPSLVPAEEREAGRVFSETLPTDASPFDVPSPLSVEEAELELLLSEAIPADVFLSNPVLPASAREAETEQLSSEAGPTNVSPFDVPLPMSPWEAEVTQLSSEPIPTNVSPFDVPSRMSAEEPEVKQFSPEAVPTEAVPTNASPFDVVLSASSQEAETEQLSSESAPREVSLPEVAPPMPGQEEAIAKGPQPKSAESLPALPVRVKVPPESRLVALTDPNSPGAEKFRVLVTRLERLHKLSELKCFQVTSSVINEGKTLVSGNVAVTLAKHFGSKTLLIEGDLHRPALAAIFGLNKMRGLSHWWSGRDQDLTQFVHQLDGLPLWFLSAGRPFDRPADILRSTRFVKAFEQLASQFEWIVVDSTPMLATVEVNLWSRLVDGTLLVVREGVTPVKALKQSLSALDHPKLIGAVLNDASATDDAKYDGHYYGSPKR
jgi:protein-tyrosine kinase